MVLLMAFNIFLTLLSKTKHAFYFGCLLNMAVAARQSGQFCGQPGSVEARDWLAVRDTLASMTQAQWAKRPKALDENHPLFSFTDLPAFDDCPLGALALRLAALQTLDVKSEGLLRYSFHEEWAALSTLDLWDVARNSGWGSVIFGSVMDLQVRVCEESETWCATVKQEGGDESQCILCDWPGGQYYGFSQAVQMHITAKEESVLYDAKLLDACDWESATGLAGVLWAQLQVYEDAVHVAPVILQRVQGVFGCRLGAPHHIVESGRWLIALLLTHRPVWGLIMVISEILERETLPIWDEYVNSNAQAAPGPSHVHVGLGRSLLDGIDGERRYLTGVKLCEGVARAEVLPTPYDGYTALVTTVAGANAFEAPAASGKLFLELPVMITGGHTPKRHYVEAYGTWVAVEDRACQSSPSAQWVKLYCIWPAEPGQKPLRTRAALTRGNLIRPATIELVTCRVPAEHTWRLKQDDIGTPTMPFPLELGSKRWTTTVQMSICTEVVGARPWLTLCPRPWFDSVAPSLGNSTLQQFIEYHAALGVDRFHIVDSDGTAMESLKPYMKIPGLIAYHNATLNSGQIPDLAGSTGNLRYPVWAVYPTCQSFYFAHCMFRNRDSHWIINLPFFDKFITGAPGMRKNVLRELLTGAAVTFARPGASSVYASSEEVGAINLHRPSMLGDPEASQDAPITGQYFTRKNLSAFSPVCGAIHMFSRALVPIYRPHKVLMPSAGHWMWLQWGKWNCYAPVQRVWINHYVKLGGRRWRGDYTGLPDPKMEESRRAEEKRDKHYAALLADGAVRDESLLWTVPWFEEIAARASSTSGSIWPLPVNAGVERSCLPSKL